MDHATGGLGGQGNGTGRNEKSRLVCLFPPEKACLLIHFMSQPQWKYATCLMEEPVAGLNTWALRLKPQRAVIS